VQAACHAQDPSTGEWAYEGWQDTIKHVTDLCASHGPFDGLWAFSQVRIPAMNFVAKLSCLSGAAQSEHRVTAQAT